MNGHGCVALADALVAALEEGRCGAVREAVAEHAPGCPDCRDRAGALAILAQGLDPEPPPIRSGFLARVMAEVRGEPALTAYDRLPPLWQVLGAAVLFVALTAVVLATGGGEAWHERALTGFLDQSLVFLGSLSQGIRGLWDAVVPGRGLPILIGCTVVATILNVALAAGVLRRRRKTVE